MNILPGVMVLADVVINGAEDDVLFAVDRAARQDDFILAGHQEALGHHEGIGEDFQALVGQKFHHAVGSGAAIDDDGFAVRAHGRRHGGQSRVFAGVAVDIGWNVSPDSAKVRLFFLRQAFGTATRAHQQVALGQPGDIAPYRRSATN
jgi:hypothetical protein